MQTPFVLLGIVLCTAYYGGMSLVGALFGMEEKAGGIYQRALHGWSRCILRISGVKVIVHGIEHTSETVGRLYISNHVSWYDIFALASVIPRCTLIAKAELKRIPFFGRAAAAAGIVFIDRDNRKSAFGSYELAAEEVKRGRSVVIFPEATRGRDYHLRPFKKGPFVLAIAAQAPVVPVFVYGTREIMPKDSFRIRRGTAHVHFLEPVSTEGMNYDDRARLMKTVWSRMAAEMNRLYGVHTGEHAIAPEGERKE